MIRIMGERFVLGRTIEDAIARAASEVVGFAFARVTRAKGGRVTAE